ncbi:MAG TPA: PepSY-associated TM helix domain-containing protein [Ignavibacteria bacterium]|nr:PepSY-associated TM helix domain-containing protein [Ignavibacteria bacterium]HMR41489.1 PepSY-associated TM helix domain-containing protein [Ignavibacteria bacterium]
MTSENKRSRQAKTLRAFRKIHRILGMFLFIVFLFISVSGIMLGWKKNSGGMILPESFEGTSADLRDWLPIDSLHKNAVRILHDSISPGLSEELERIDIRKDKGMVKFVFIENYIGIQIDGATGELLNIETRRSDFIENIHDGSILDYIFNTGNEQIKLVYTSIAGLSLFAFTVTGFWLWFGPKLMRRKK